MEKRHHGDEKGRRPYPDPSLTPGGRATQRPRPAERGGVTMKGSGVRWSWVWILPLCFPAVSSQ